MAVGDLRGAGLYELSSVGSDDFSLGAKANAAGLAQFNLNPPGSGGFDWLIAYLVGTVSTNGIASVATNIQATVYTSSVAWSNIWDQCAAGLGQAFIGWYNPPRRIKSSQLLIAQFTGCTAGDYAQLRCEYAFDTSSR